MSVIHHLGYAYPQSDMHDATTWGHVGFYCFQFQSIVMKIPIPLNLKHYKLRY